MRKRKFCNYKENFELEVEMGIFGKQIDDCYNLYELFIVLIMVNYCFGNDKLFILFGDIGCFLIDIL